MGMNDTPSGERVHIGFFGQRNAGKSSIVNAVTGQDLSVVSDTAGTTTDPVNKAMELLPLGPVLITDTPGFDDTGELGEMRVQKTRQVLRNTDIAVLVVDAVRGLQKGDRQLLNLFRERDIPYLLVFNKADRLPEGKSCQAPEDAGVPDKQQITVSAGTGYHINELKEKMARMKPSEGTGVPLVADLIHPGDFVVLVVPIDSAAPKGRLILPQQQMIRDILEADATSVVVKESGLEQTLRDIGKTPAMVITDSQAFGKVSAIVPESIPLTSFSILMARYKGFLKTAVKGVSAIGRLQDGDTVLISEGCTHHRQCDDIGTVKLPKWLREFTGKNITFETSSGRGFPEDLSPYSLVLHCGGCMLNEREMQSRMRYAVEKNVPFTNYGTAIAYTHGILKRSLELFPEIRKELFK